MSENPPHRPRQSAGDLVRSILDDRPRPEEEVSPTGELFRVIERFHESVDRARRTIDDLTLATSGGGNPPNHPGGSSSLHLHRRFSQEPTSRDSPSGTASPPSLPPLRYYVSRRNPNMPSGSRQRYRPGGTDRHRASASSNPTSSSNLGGTASSAFAELELRLDSANSRLRSILDLNPSPVFSQPSPPPMSTPDHAQDSLEGNRRAKRRKLEASSPAPPSQALRYGRYGQVESGQLIMEIVSCDGGNYTEGMTSYAAENILKDDNSVYCTKGSRCNIVLQHQGATVFSLKELVIKAPGINYSSPVREGMVFVSMERDELLVRTAQYQIQYGRAKSQDRQGSERDGRVNAPIFSIRHGDDGAPATRISGRRRVMSIMDDQEERMSAQIPSEFTVAPPPFRVTTECSEDEDDNIPVNMRHRRRTPNRIGSLPFESDNSDDWGQMDDSALGDVDISFSTERGENMTLQEAIEANQLATQEAVRAVGGTMMAPHARFFIEKDKSKCTIRFDPPVSGRFILLKMWSPHLESGNIDIQAVVAKGFAGPRFIPSVDLL
ncbi:hypothetical protein MCOR22_008248 [Pyricularia oryzae]|nr:hypothetical protein MCOR22_008248 [Pyricularia oryzae]